MPSLRYTLLPMLLLCGATASHAVAPVECHLTAARIARAFYSGETVTLYLRVSGPDQTANYEVRDYSQARVLSGALAVGGDRTSTLSFPKLASGIYYLRLTFPSGDPFNDAFCVIPRPDAEAGEPSLWGYQYGGSTESLYGMLAQVGMRYVRFDLTWVDHERQRGVYDMTKADWYARVAKRYGLQIIPTLGYTPSWTALKPDDMPDLRSHTWAPDAVEDWAEFVRRLRDRIGGQTVTWPTTEVVPAKPVPQTRVSPLAKSWEIWNEADQNYYYGPWGRYLDLLRVAWGVLKQPTDRVNVCYGGSCAHWTEMAKTYDAGCGPYFDEIAWHSNGDTEWAVKPYYYGAPQIGYKYLLPRPTIQTECYPTTTAGVPEPEYVLRLYTALKAAGETTYCYASIGQTLVGAADPNSRAMVYSSADTSLVPNAKYVAFATTRWLLQSAAYLGPVDLGTGVTANLFARNGLATLVAWASTPTTVTIPLGEDNPRRMDIMGRMTALPGRSYTVEVSGSPLVVLDVSRALIPAAMQAYFERAMATEFGFAYSTDSPYVRTLGADANWRQTGANTQPARLRNSLATCLAGLQAARRPKWASLGPFVTEVGQAMVNLGTAAAGYGSIRYEMATAVWRLQKMAEWAAAAIDAGMDGTGAATRQAQAALVAGLDAARAGIASSATGVQRPLAETLLDRGYLLAADRDGRPGTGASLAVNGAIAAAQRYAQTEGAKQVSVLVVGHFPTARLMKRAYLFAPAATHQLQAQVFNYTSQTVSGTVAWKLPTGWTNVTGSVAFTVPAGGYSERLTCEVSIAGDASPWVTRTVTPPGSSFSVTIPSALSAMTSVSVTATLSDGRQTTAMPYDASVGIWVP